jgi:hypothetical protein
MQSGSAAEIVFDHVTKRYPGRDQPAVNDLSLTIPQATSACAAWPNRHFLRFGRGDKADDRVAACR